MPSGFGVYGRGRTRLAKAVRAAMAFNFRVYGLPYTLECTRLARAVRAAMASNFRVYGLPYTLERTRLARAVRAAMPLSAPVAPSSWCTSAAATSLSSAPCGADACVPPRRQGLRPGSHACQAVKY